MGCDFGGLPRKLRFVKNDVSADQSLFGDWVVQPPAFLPLLKAQEDAPLGVPLQAVALVFEHHGICSTAEYAKSAEIRFVTVPGLVGSHASDSDSGAGIEHLGDVCGRFSPVDCREVSLSEESNDPLLQFAIEAFADTILGGGGTDCSLMLDAPLCKAIVPEVSCVLSTLVIENAQLLSTGILS